MSASPVGVEHLLRLLDVEELDRDLYRGPHPENGTPFHMYGGQAAGQAMVAASRTVPLDRHVHSLHGYFLRPGASDRPAIIEVFRDRDGRSFSARRVVVKQGGEVIFSAAMSFHVDEEGPEYDGIAFPEGVPMPEEIPEEPAVGHNSMLELRPVVTGFRGPGGAPHAMATFWARTRGPVPEDRTLHAALLVYLSDLGTGFSKVDQPGLPKGGPSIDHAVWLYGPARVDEWVLVDQWPVRSYGARGVYGGAIWDRTGRSLASIAQDSLLRPGMQRRPDPPGKAS